MDVFAADVEAHLAGYPCVASTEARALLPVPGPRGGGGPVSGRRVATRRGARGAEALQRLRLDPAGCDGIGMCAHVAAGLVGLDDWGYPVPPDRPLEPGERRAAGAAVAACPRRALFLAPAGR
jgi:ferredoxin